MSGEETGTWGSFVHLHGGYYALQWAFEEIYASDAQNHARQARNLNARTPA